MSRLAFAFLLAFLLIYSVPVLLLRTRQAVRMQDYVVGAGPTPPGILQNASIAYALRLVLFAPAFIWGARGDLLPALLFAAAAALGILLLYVLRQPLHDFLQAALRRDQSITVHAFVAGLHGDDRRVRSLAAGLSVIALSGLLAAEAVGLTALLKPMQPGSALWAYLLTGLMLAAVAFCATPSGHSAVLHTAQAQLGMAYLGLFGAAAFLLYLLLAAFPPMPRHGTLAIASVAVICVAMLVYRRSRYVDTSPINLAVSPRSGDFVAAEPRAGRLFRRFNKMLNPLLSALLVMVAVFALIGLVPFGIEKVMQDAAATLRQPTSLSGLELATIVLLPLCYPMVDVTNWQRLAAFEKEAPTNYDRTAEFRRFIRAYAVETALVLLFVVMMSAIAATATATTTSADAVRTFIARLALQQNLIAAGALSFLLIATIAIAFSTMVSLFSAGLCALHSDLLPAPHRGPDEAGSTHGKAGLGTLARPRMVAVGLGLFLAVITAFALAESLLGDRFVSRSYLAIPIALACCQLSSVPLVLGSAVARRRGTPTSFGPRWSLMILGSSTAVGLGAVIAHLATGKESWLWAAVPACLGAGILLSVLAWIWPAKAAAAV